MTLIVELPAELEASLRQRAEKDAKKLNDFVVQAVREKIAKERSFAEICEPFAKAVAETGISEDEFDRFFEEQRDEAWREKHG